MAWSGGEITRAGACLSHFCRFFSLLHEQTQERNWIAVSHLMKCAPLTAPPVKLHPCLAPLLRHTDTC